MPDFSCQVYWHNIEEAYGVRDAVHVPPAPVVADPAGTNRLRIDQGLTPLAALEEVLSHLREPSVTAAELGPLMADAEEAADLRLQMTQQSQRNTQALPATEDGRRPRAKRGSKKAQDQAMSGEPPVAMVLKALFEERGFAVRTLPREEFRTGLSPLGFFQAGHTCVFMVDKEQPIFTAAYLHPTARAKAGGQVQVLCPVQDPVPFRFRTKVLTNMSFGESVVLCVTRETDDSTGRKRPREAPPLEPTSADLPEDNPFARLPVVEAPDRYRRRKGVQHAWYLRLMRIAARRRYRELARLEVDDRAVTDEDGVGAVGGPEPDDFGLDEAYADDFGV